MSAIRSRKLAGGVATIIVDATGLSAAEAKRVEEELRAAALAGRRSQRSAHRDDRGAAAPRR